MSGLPALFTYAPQSVSTKRKYISQFGGACVKTIALPHVTTRPWTGETHVSNKLPLATTRARTGETHVSNALPLVATRARTGETHVLNELKKKKPLVTTRFKDW